MEMYRHMMTCVTEVKDAMAVDGGGVLREMRAAVTKPALAKSACAVRSHRSAPRSSRQTSGATSCRN